MIVMIRKHYILYGIKLAKCSILSHCYHLYVCKQVSRRRQCKIFAEQAQHSQRITRTPCQYIQTHRVHAKLYNFAAIIMGKMLYRLGRDPPLLSTMQFVMC